MPSSNDHPQNPGVHQSAKPDPTNDPQLEIEIRAFAELLLDIYEYRYWQKRKNPGPPVQFDDGLGERKMK